MAEGAAAWLGIAAIARLALAIACCPPSQVMLVPICGDTSHRIAIPLDRKKAPRDDQPTGCHAVCGRKLAGETDDCADC